MTDKVILWGLWSEADREWNGDLYNKSVEAFTDKEEAEKCGNDEWRPRPLAIEIGAYRALRDALELAIRCLGYKTLSPEDIACIVTALNTDLAVADAVLTTCGEEGKSPCER